MSLIPKKIFQSWKSKDLNDTMKKVVQKIKDMNPDYEYHFFDDNDCRKYLLDNYGENYANAFDVLKPGAFKCDFWRYAVLYKEGGVYLDLDMTPEVPFDDFISPSDRFVSVVDRKIVGLFPCAIYQAFIAAEPGHPILKYALDICFVNIATRRFDLFETLSVTGPVSFLESIQNS